MASIRFNAIICVTLRTVCLSTSVQQSWNAVKCGEIPQSELEFRVRRPHQECHFFAATWPKKGFTIGKIHRKFSSHVSSAAFFPISLLLWPNYYELLKLQIRNSSCSKSHRGNSHILGPPISSIPVPRLNLAKVLRPTDASCRRFSR